MVFCRHKARATFECPGGHREPGESVLEAEKRELYEETGAVRYEIEEIKLFEKLPEVWTYPKIQPVLLKKIMETKVWDRK